MLQKEKWSRLQKDGYHPDVQSNIARIEKDIKNIDDPKTKEEFKNSPQKFAVMNQMMIQCKILSNFAQESGNDIFKKYEEIVSSIERLSLENPEIKQILSIRYDDKISKHMKELIEEFKSTEKQKSALAA